MVVQPIRYERLEISQEHPWDQTHSRRKNKMLVLSQDTYINAVLTHFRLQDSKKGDLPFRHGIILFKDQCPKALAEIESIKIAPYASAVESLMYAMLCTRPDICFDIGMVSRYQSNPGREH